MDKIKNNENVSLIFNGIKALGKARMSCEFDSFFDSIRIHVYDGKTTSIVYLNKSTSVRLSKELKKQIGNFNES